MAELPDNKNQEESSSYTPASPVKRIIAWVGWGFFVALNARLGWLSAPSTIMAFVVFCIVKPPQREEAYLRGSSRPFEGAKKWLLEGAVLLYACLPCQADHCLGGGGLHADLRRPQPLPVFPRRNLSPAVWR